MRFLRWIGLGPRGAVAALTDMAGKPLNFLRPLALVSDLSKPAASRRRIPNRPGTSVVIPDVHRPVGRRELLRRTPSFEGFPCRLELRFRGIDVLG